MYTLLLAILYLAFISLGLPDSLLGSAWPVLHAQLDVPMSYAGLLTMLIAGGTILSSLCSDRLTRRFGAGMVTAVSVLMTAVALWGFSVSASFAALVVWSIPYGLGAGAVDAALNNYVALHYASRHMSWLHCFWGVGASISPYIMSACLTSGAGWQQGYRSVSLIQLGLTLCVFLSLPLWHKKETAAAAHPTAALRLPEIFRIPGVPYVLLTFFGYSALETTAGLWASSYLVNARAIAPGTAAKFASLFYLGITFGRFLSGFFAERIGDRRLIRFGVLTIAAGIILLWLPVDSRVPTLAGLIVIGFGCAPIYPAIIHSTPAHFGKERSQAVIGIQMACAYLGSTFMPPVFGWISGQWSISWYPLFLFVFCLLMLWMSERLNRRIPT